MTIPLKPLTLLVAAIVLVVGTLVGFRLLTAKADTATVAPTCTNRTIADGEKLTSNRVTVNVLNASTRSGLANRVAINLQRRGFLGGTVGNSTSNTKPSKVTILTADRKDPRVKLVAMQFRDKVTYAKSDIPAAKGVTVVVGDGALSGLRPETRTFVVSDRPIQVCVPIIRLS
ncbi:LytR C-terminal domain-containing protein [Aeromicrobium sp.]|uniref:LytR C-terminal domain-containing protein n=1 Tax=Aeromicrobium sp. TaxID=1871063 RepID=UPI0019A6645C|nr:LytR C-terminal domain-containing protein [Aeromicrobium sp.]MBC7631400.1 LytR C-terminal domain-containing protein [Aeromicrobium sp.]